MAISVDTVYQTVQRELNVEQRGQLSPTDFNYFANLAQLDLFNKSIYDMGHFKINPKGIDYNIMQNLEEQIDIFMTTLDTYQSRTSLPSNLHTLIRVVVEGKVAEKMMHKDVQYITSSSLTAPTTTFPKYTRVYSGDGVGSVIVYPETTTVSIDYIRKPSEPHWGFIEVQQTPIYNSGASTDFELHNSRQDDLTQKILLYSAMSVKQQEVAVFAQNELTQDMQQEKN